jgi:hypothetical protein
MIKILLLLAMIFLHIVDDYYLQGWLASAKQKSWWEKNAPDELYRYDYIMALFMHSFSWTFIVMIIPTYCTLTSRFVADGDFTVVSSQIIFVFILNLITHMTTDNAKANLKKINLIQDQLIHLLQLVLTWFYLVVIR